jgi:hypothetical protein
MTFSKGGVAGHLQFVVALDSEKSPKQVRLYPVGKDEKERLLGIYAVDDEGRLEITCRVSFQRNDPPIAFGDVSSRTWVFERVPAPEQQKKEAAKDADGKEGSKQAVAFPDAYPPLFARVVGVNKDKGVITLSTAEVSMVGMGVRGRQVEVDLKKVCIYKPVTAFNARVSEVEVEVKWLRVTDMNDKTIEGDEIWRRLTPGTMVVRGASHSLDPAFRKMLAKDVLYVVPAGNW